MDIYDLEKKIMELLSKGKEMNTDDIENSIEKKDLEECSDKIAFALLRLKNKSKIQNRFDGKSNFWSIKPNKK